MDQVEDYIKRILKTVIFIEKNIDEDLTLDQLAKIACYSPFHFHRIFQAIVGETVHQYIKRLRLQRAGVKLRYTDQSVTEIALETSYDTPSAFTKAFKQYMGSSPRDFRTLNRAVDTITKKMTELKLIQPDTIEKNLPDLNLFFVRRHGQYTQSPKEAWEAMNGFINENNLDRSQLRYFGIGHDDPNVSNEEKLRYDAAIYTKQTVVEKGEVGRQVLRGGKYAIFSHRGSYDAMNELYNRIFLKWLPNSNEVMDERRAIFLEYFNMEYHESEPEKLLTKVNIPLILKKRS